MNRYLITGVDSSTGAAMSFQIEAENASDAATIARNRGVHVSKVEPLDYGTVGCATIKHTTRSINSIDHHL
ncbi:MAG: hypothetical protein QM811_19085 [Pirellulales bacterium]